MFQGFRFCSYKRSGIFLRNQSFQNFPPTSFSSFRNFHIPSTPALKSGGLIANILAGAYLGGFVVCFGSLYFLYRDANDRQNIPFSLSWNDQLSAVKAIGKDDVLKSPRHAVKHYRRLLIDLAKEADPEIDFQENLPDGSINYVVPLLNPHVLLGQRKPAFSNFYIDIVLRYSKALLAKGRVQESRVMLKTVIDNDDLFYRLGDAERVAQCCTMLSKLLPTPKEKLHYLTRSFRMLKATFLRILVDDSTFIIDDDSRLTDELVTTLTGIASAYARESPHSKQKNQLLTDSLNIYLALLRNVSRVKDVIESNELTQASFPLFDCRLERLITINAELKAHISEVLWAKGLKKNAIAWGEEVVDEIYFEHGKIAAITPILTNVLDNLTSMYIQTKDRQSAERCRELKNDLKHFDADPPSWYDSFVNRVTRIIYYKGPLGIIEKPLKERFGLPEPLPNIEEYEDEDEE